MMTTQQELAHLNDKLLHARAKTEDAMKDVMNNPCPETRAKYVQLLREEVSAEREYTQLKQIAPHPQDLKNALGVEFERLPDSLSPKSAFSDRLRGVQDQTHDTYDHTSDKSKTR